MGDQLVSINDVPLSGGGSFGLRGNGAHTPDPDLESFKTSLRDILTHTTFSGSVLVGSVGLRLKSFSWHMAHGSHGSWGRVRGVWGARGGRQNAEPEAADKAV